MFEFIDKFLDQITMYRLTLYVLIAYLAVACIIGFFGLLSYSPQNIIITSLMLTGSMWFFNKLCSYLFNAPTNVESVYISALILACILTPAATFHERLLVLATGCIAVVSKFVLAIHKKHIFNPAAIAIVIASFAYGYYASWWIGTASMLPITLIGGILILKKLQRMHMALSFLIVAFSAALFVGLQHAIQPLQIVKLFFFDSASIFFATIMLTEPLTAPPTLLLRTIYGGIVGLLFTPQLHIGPIFATPELALIVGNLYSYIVSPKQKLLLTLKEKVQIGKDEIDFTFYSPQKFAFLPGQYMEWTLPHKHTDSRGNRRYFTLANSPTEEDIHLGVKFYEQSSSFKKALRSFSDHEMIIAGSLSGDFTLPKNTTKKLVFLAGGIGITPFRSMIKYLLDTNQKRDIVLLYSNKSEDEIMYQDIFAKAKIHGVKTVYTLTEESLIHTHWKGEKGRVTGAMIQKEIPDYKDRIFYLSGPHAMIEGFALVLKEMGIHSSSIKKDFFPGFV